MPEGQPNHGRLDSWKEIAAHIGRDKRTAIRWEKEKGLPVHRVPGGPRQRVFAYKHELDLWLTKGRPPATTGEPEEATSILPERLPSTQESVIAKEGQSLSRRYLLAFTIALIAIAAVMLGLHFAGRSPRVPLVNKIGFSASGIQAFDDAGRLVWTHTFSQLIHIEPSGDMRGYENLVRFADLKGDGRREILVAVPGTRLLFE